MEPHCNFWGTRSFLRRLFTLLTLLIAAFAASAQSYPQRPVRIIVPYPPGSGTDIAARLMGQKLSDLWTQPLVIENRPGAAAMIGTDAVAKAPADGYTIGIADVSSLAINMSLYSKVAYDPVKDLAAVSLVANVPFILVASPGVPARNVPELIALAKSRPGQLNYASVGNGSAVHLAMELFQMRAGIQLTHVPYKGSAPALQGLLGGETSVMFVNLLSALPLVQSGKLRALAAAPATRISSVPDLPTIAEAGLPGYDFNAWFGIVAPAGTPKAVVDKLNQDLRRVIALPEIREMFINKGGFEPVGSSVESFTAYIPAEIERWGKVVRATGAKAD